MTFPRLYPGVTMPSAPVERKYGDPGAETASVASGKDVEEMREAKSRGGVWRGHGLSESIWAR